jgi:hypothetical protein
MFAVVYTVFGALVVQSWFRVRPRPFGVARSNLWDATASRKP